MHNDPQVKKRYTFRREAENSDNELRRLGSGMSNILDNFCQSRVVEIRTVVF